MRNILKKALWVLAIAIMPAAAHAGDLLENFKYRTQQDFGILATGKLSGMPEIEGTYTIRYDGKSFMVDSENMKLWFDGTTLWRYSADGNYKEIYITTPDDREKALLNPLQLLTTYQSYLDVTFPEAHSIMLVQKNDADGWSARLELTEKNRLKTIKVRRPHDFTTEIKLEITSYTAEQKFTPETFRCDTSKFPGADIIDMR